MWVPKAVASRQIPNKRGVHDIEKHSAAADSGAGAPGPRHSAVPVDPLGTASRGAPKLARGIVGKRMALALGGPALKGTSRKERGKPLVLPNFPRLGLLGFHVHVTSNKESRCFQERVAN